MLDTATRRETATGTAPALKGIKVLDLTQFEAGPSCTEALAWFGAEVVKVEEPNRGEPGRWGFSDLPDADSHYFIYYNLNKRSITCNLKTDEGKALLTRLIEKADVLVENMAPGTFARLRFDAPPIKPGASVGDTGTGMLCAMGILAALYQRMATGRGQHIQIAMRDAMLN